MPTLRVQGHDGTVHLIDNPSESLSVVNLVWDAIGLAWVKQTQAAALGVAPTEYTEDAVAVADPVGTIPLFVRKDVPSALVSLDGDNVAQRGTNFGAIYVTDLDAAGNPTTVAHGTADSGNPTKLGAKVETSLETVTLAANGSRSNVHADADGVPMIKLYCPLGDVTQDRVANTDGVSTAFTNFGAVAGVRNYVTTITVFNSSATDGFVDLRDGAAGAVIFTVPAPKGGGAVISLPVPLRQPTVNTALAFDVSGALTTVYISVVGFQSKL